MTVDEEAKTLILYWPNGVVREISNMKNNERHGVTTYYNRNGVFLSKHFYVCGIPIHQIF